MNKIYYLKEEVEIGQEIYFKGLKIKITQELIDDNPELFEVKENHPEYIKLLRQGCQVRNTGEKALDEGKIYKVISIYINPYYDLGYILEFDSIKAKIAYNSNDKSRYLIVSSKEDYLIQEANNRGFNKVGIRIKNKGLQPSCKENEVISIKYKYESKYDRLWLKNATKLTYSICIYDSGKWAEIEKPIFTTSDGINIYEEDNYWICPKPCNDEYWPNKLKNYPKVSKGVSANDFNYWITFSTKELSEKYISDNTEKTLSDYEDILLKNEEILYKMIGFTYGTFYHLMKNMEPKLYWIKVLQLIADDLNEGWKPDLHVEDYKYTICYDYFKEKYIIYGMLSLKANCTYFKSKELVEKAMKLIESHLPLIYGI